MKRYFFYLAHAYRGFKLIWLIPFALFIPKLGYFKWIMDADNPTEFTNREIFGLFYPIFSIIFILYLLKILFDFNPFI